jgi:hypothetical protein
MTASTVRTETIVSDLVPEFEPISIALGLRCPWCPGACSLIPHDVRLTEGGTIEVMCPCCQLTLLSAKPIEWETVDERDAL